MNHSLSNPGAAGPGSMSLHDGSQTSAAAVNSVAVQGGSTTIRGQYAFAGGESGATAQTSTFVLKKQTTDATPTVLVTNRIIEVTSPGTANQIILRDSSAVAFTGIIVARRKASEGTQSAAWRVEGLIRREANAAATVLVSSVVNTISNVPGWTIALTADTTNGGLAVTATGGAAASIYWAATMQTSEVVHF
jgi:hypothetical protein